MCVPAEALIIIKSKMFWVGYWFFSAPSPGAQLISTLRASLYATRNGPFGLNLPRCDSNSAAGEAAASVSWADEALWGREGKGEAIYQLSEDCGPAVGCQDAPLADAMTLPPLPGSRVQVPASASGGECEPDPQGVWEAQSLAPNSCLRQATSHLLFDGKGTNRTRCEQALRVGGGAGHLGVGSILPVLIFLCN